MCSPNFSWYNSIRRRRWPDSSARMPLNIAAVAGKVSTQTFREVRVDALILLFQGNRQCQDLSFRKTAKVSHGGWTSASLYKDAPGGFLPAHMERAARLDRPIRLPRPTPPPPLNLPQQCPPQRATECDKPASPRIPSGPQMSGARPLLKAAPQKPRDRRPHATFLLDSLGETGYTLLRK